MDSPELIPICANCESVVEYKGGMVCHKCNFDFKLYWFTPRQLLQLKFHKISRRTFWNIAFMLLWMFVPPLGCAATSKALIDRGYPLCSYLMFGLITLPVTRIFFVDPILAWFKEDHLREVDALKEEN